MRIAETRAVNRALRKAYGIGLCFGSRSWVGFPISRARQEKHEPSVPFTLLRWFKQRQPKLRDRLCVLIPSTTLDPIQVKAYAADFCGTPTLTRRQRELVESFISHLATCRKGKQGWPDLQTQFLCSTCGGEGYEAARFRACIWISMESKTKLEDYFLFAWIGLTTGWLHRNHS